MQALSLPAIIHLITMPVYLGAGITALVRQSVRHRAKNWLAAYLLVAAFSATLQMASAWELLPEFVGQYTAIYSVLIIAYIFWYRFNSPPKHKSLQVSGLRLRVADARLLLGHRSLLDE